MDSLYLRNRYSQTLRQNQYTEAYNTLFSGSDKLPISTGLFISRRDYKAGYSIFVIDIAGSCSSDYIAKKQNSHTRLDIKFASPIPLGGATLILYATYPGLIQIEESRKILIQ